MALAPLSAGFQSLLPLPTMKLDPLGSASPVGGFVYILGPCGSLQLPLLWGWEFLLLTPQTSRVFSIRGLRLYFPSLEPWVAWPALLPHHSSRFIYAQMWGPGYTSNHLVGSASCSLACPIPQSSTSLGPPAATLLRVLSAPATHLHPSYWSWWMFLLYLLGCQTSMRFDFLSVLVVLCFKIVVVLLLVVREGMVCLPTPPSWLEVSYKDLNLT